MESKFTGGLGGMIVTNLLCGLLIIITLGIGTPWAVAKRERWYKTHTIVDGHKVTFDGTGAQLFGNYIKWLLLTIITFGIYGLWLGINMQKWIAAHTHLE